MSINISELPKNNIVKFQIISGDIATERVFPIINPNDNDISEIPLIQQIRFFINQVERSNGIKLTKAGNLPPARPTVRIPS